MVQFATLALAASVIGANALNLHKRTDGGAPRVVEHKIARKSIPNHADVIKRDRRIRSNRLNKRASTVSATLDNEETLYYANVTIGTPAQSLRLHIDTGSSDLWVNTANSSYCEEKGSPCAAAGTYSSSASSTWKWINDLFNITYEDGSGAAGPYGSDNVVIGGATLTAQEFGIGETSSSQEGILGIGYADNEAIIEYTTNTYANVPEHMVQLGLINSNAYSLWLNDLDASEGSILFGGINTDKYTGTLYTLPIVKEDDEYVEFIIAMTDIGTNGNVGSIASGIDEAALLDSGTSLTYLPNAITQDLFNLFDASYSDQDGYATIDCSYATNSTTIDFTFSGATISVSMAELVIVDGYEGKKEICIFGIAPAEGSTPVLGDTFLRSAYVVYDLYENEISIAQTDFNSTSSNIVEITNTTVPDSTVVSTAATTVAQETGSDSQITGVATHTSKAEAPLITNMLSYGALAAAGAGMVFAL